MTCGVYEFWCGPHFYQGSSKNIEGRWKSHLNDLKAGRHVNDRAQKAYDKYGWTDAGILVECEEHALEAWEQAYIDTNWGDEKYLNLSPTAGRMPSTIESRQKNRIKARAQWEDPTVRARQTAAIRQSQSAPDVKDAKSRRASESWGCAEVRAKMESGLVRGWADPDRAAARRQRIGAGIRAGHARRLVIDLFGMEF
jgi:hypothetical protein